MKNENLRKWILDKKQEQKKELEKIQKKLKLERNERNAKKE